MEYKRMKMGGEGDKRKGSREEGREVGQKDKFNTRINFHNCLTPWSSHVQSFDIAKCCHLQSPHSRTLKSYN